MSTVTIVMYHYVRDYISTAYPRIKGIDVGSFKKQLKYFLKYYRIIRMQDLLETLRGEKTIPGNSLLLTFDDAYKDHFEFVFPILDGLGIQGSFFPPAKAIQELEVLDVNKIHFILASAETGKLLADVYSLMDRHRREYGLQSNEYYYDKLASAGRFDAPEIIFIKRLLQRHLPEGLRKAIVGELFYKYVSKDEASFSRNLYMNVDQLRCIHRHGMYVGSHGWDHYWLNTLPEHKQDEEIRSSLKFLDIIGCDTSQWVMCYPYGAYNDSLLSVLRSYGCKLALTTEVGIADLTKDDPLTLPRLDTNDLPKDEHAEPNEWTLKAANN